MGTMQDFKHAIGVFFCGGKKVLIVEVRTFFCLGCDSVVGLLVGR